MGTDIHGIMQAKKDGKWVDIPHNYDEDRHYALFAWLGNVRNGFGFAGIKTHEPLKPLSDRRGLPADFEHVDYGHQTTADCLPEYEREGFEGTKWMGDHSYSWVSSEEILGSEHPLVKQTGVLDTENNMDYFIEEIQRLVNEHGPVRYVFGFDS